MDRRTALKYLLSGISTLAVAGNTSAQESAAGARLSVLLERRGIIRLGLASGKQSVRLEFGGRAVGLVDGKNVAFDSPVSIQKSGSGGSITSPSGSMTFSQSVTVNAGAGELLIDGSAYRGGVMVTPGLSIINLVQIDDWLKGVLPSEIGSDAPLEALKAQAVAARSEALFRLKKPPHESSGYDFCTGVHCQAYKGKKGENAQCIQAVEETFGYVLLANNDILNAVYSNVCGGITAGAEDVWDSKAIPGLQPVYDTPSGVGSDLSSEQAARRFIENPDPQTFCNAANPNYANYAKKYFRWSKTVSAAEIQRSAGVGPISNVEVIERRPSGKVRKLRITGSRGSKVIDKELPIRNALGLWSGLFVVDLEHSGGQITAVKFSGAGNGHGVGLCQHGAREIARRGGSFEKILGHYFRGASLRKIYRP